MASGGAPRPQLTLQRGQTRRSAPAKAAPEPTGWAATPNFNRERAAAAATPYTGMNWNPKKDADVMVAEYRKPRPAPTGLINKYR
ncbi:hypothetical protein UFOVP474_41 [uncultured Caudovirales phage]|uniref:Uncharacterized protein n=1 Tax=uncultured Caudovirales phage TaxID=2100421 RepID=A0A6J5R8V7_9CAUD|nr:hypothetical protein UFOVP474_41 [uncultured Caudovirales phage]CAB4189971.1 hypothetical protein UFOVP1207_37 [uncultured Caudovirales phage]